MGLPPFTLEDAMDTLNYIKLKEEFKQIEKKERIQENRNMKQPAQKINRTDKLLNESKRDEFWEYLIKCK